MNFKLLFKIFAVSVIPGTVIVMSARHFWPNSHELIHQCMIIIYIGIVGYFWKKSRGEL